MAGAVPRVALVTGSSSGIGEATALALAKAGYRVYASGRTLEGVEPLRGRVPALVPIQLDVRDDGSIDAAVSKILRESGRVDLLVNNAGFPIFGAVEDLPREELRRQFEVNVFGAMAVCRRVLPTMRRQGCGCIVNVSSIAGKISVPLLGAYCASKFALEGFSDALRVEARPFGVRVVVVEPGSTLTPFRKRARAESTVASAAQDSPYRTVYRFAIESYSTPAVGTSAEQVARRIVRIARKRRPAPRYRVKWYDTVAIGFATALPRSVIDAFVSRWLGLHRLGSGAGNSHAEHPSRNS